ncbi:MAG: hypothetical protein Q8R00_01950 [Candidatus Nanoarchaeia archaeon]|nr:hypothetical protein [Candidatus Nanoarchaeia archaeon]
MSLLDRFSRDNVRRGKYWAKKAERIPVKESYNRGSLKRLIFFERAEEYMKACYDAVKFLDEEDDRLPALQRQYLNYSRKKIIQQNRIEQEFGKNVESLRRAMARRVGYTTGWTFAGGVAAAAVAGVLYFVNQVKTKNYEAEAQNLYNKINVALENPERFKKEDLEKLDSDASRLGDIVRNLLEADYPEIHKKKIEVNTNLHGLIKLSEARKQFAEVKRLAEGGDRIAALGVNIELGGIRDQLPVSWYEFFDLFEKQYEKFRDENKSFEFVSKQLKFAGEQLEGFNGEIKSLDTLIDQGKDFENEKAETLAGNIRSSLAQLGALEISIGEGPGKEKFVDLKNKLKLVENSLDNLYTKRANLRAKNVTDILTQIQPILDALEISDYLEQNDSEKITKLKQILASAESTEATIDASKLQDPRALTRKIINYGNDVAMAERMVNEILRLRGDSEIGEAGSTLRLIDLVMEHDLDDGDWNGDVLPLLNKVQQDQRGPVGTIADIYARHEKKEGFISVTESGLIASNIEDYRTAIKNYSNSGNVRPLSEALNSLLNKSSLDEGKNTKILVDTLSDLRDKRLDLEMRELPEDASQEDRDNRTKEIEELKKQETEVEKEALEAVNGFEKAVSNLLVQGNLEPPISDLDELIRLFTMKDENEMAIKIQVKKDQLKKKYNW